MSTQHPDNANQPPWVEGEIIGGNDEVHELRASARVRKMLSNNQIDSKLLGRISWLLFQHLSCQLCHPHLNLNERSRVDQFEQVQIV